MEGGVTHMMRGQGKEGEKICKGMGCRDKQQKGWGSHCHANWCSAQTPMSCKEESRGKSEV